MNQSRVFKWADVELVRQRFQGQNYIKIPLNSIFIMKVFFLSLQRLGLRLFWNITDFPGGPVVKTLHLQCRGAGSIPGQGTKIPHAAQCGQNAKKCYRTISLPLVGRAVCFLITQMFFEGSEVWNSLDIYWTFGSLGGLGAKQMKQAIVAVIKSSGNLP